MKSIWDRFTEGRFAPVKLTWLKIRILVRFVRICAEKSSKKKIVGDEHCENSIDYLIAASAYSMNRNIFSEALKRYFSFCRNSEYRAGIVVVDGRYTKYSDNMQGANCFIHIKFNAWNIQFCGHTALYKFGHGHRAAIIHMTSVGGAYADVVGYFLSDPQSGKKSAANMFHCKVPKSKVRLFMKNCF